MPTTRDGGRLTPRSSPLCGEHETSASLSLRSGRTRPRSLLGRSTATLVVSDVHLAPVFDSDRLPFRSACFSPAAYLSQTIDHAVAYAQKTRSDLEIVLDGDVFDFDVPQSAEEAARGLRLVDATTPVVATDVLHRTLLDHLSFTLALQRAVRAGARLIVLPGNHDAQLGFASVQELLKRVIGPGVTFAPWYYAAADGAVHVEHGHLYDPLCAVSRLCLENVTNTERTIGTVSSFYAPLLFPGVDPFVSDPFAERRSFREAMIAQGLPGTRALLACMKELLVASAQSHAAPDDARALAFALGVEPSEVDYRRSFFAPKASASEVLDICRGSIDYGASVEERTRRAMEAATTMHGAQVAVVGHTHRPGASALANGSVLLNSGAWTPRRTGAEAVGSYAWITTSEGRVEDASVKQVYRA